MILTSVITGEKKEDGVTSRLIRLPDTLGFLPILQISSLQFWLPIRINAFKLRFEWHELAFYLLGRYGFAISKCVVNRRERKG